MENNKIHFLKLINKLASQIKWKYFEEWGTGSALVGRIILRLRLTVSK